MKTEPKLAVALIAAALLCGCAGGSGMTVTTGPDPRPAPVDHGCGTVPGYDIQCEPYFPGGNPQPTSSPTGFTNWANVKTGIIYVADAVTTLLYIEPDLTSVSVDVPSESPQRNTFRYDGLGGLDHISADGSSYLPQNIRFNSWNEQPKTQSLAGIGHPEIQIGRSFGPIVLQTPFLSVSEEHAALFADPNALAWNYQTFGVWETAGATLVVAASSFGAATPGSAVPTSGAATFTGKLAGLYISPTGQGSIAAADLAVNADFSTRSLSFASTSTTTTRDLVTATAAPNLNLSGTLTYSPGLSTFTGTLTNAGGTMNGASKGQFYGPAAQELGGVFTVKSSTTVETLVGAYGAKR